LKDVAVIVHSHELGPVGGRAAGGRADAGASASLVTPAVTGRTHAAALAGEGDDKPLAAARAPGAGESEAEEPAER
jgi:hypothetical protein